jgi:uncharacterized membrane protein YkgB
MDQLNAALLGRRWFKSDFDYHFIRLSLVSVFFYFGYQKWSEHTAAFLVPYISHGPFIFWMSEFGQRGASYFLGVSEWSFGTLLLLGFWNKKIGVLGALGSIATFVGTVTIIPFFPSADVAPPGGVPFLIKDIVLLAASFYLLKQDVLRATDPKLLSSSNLGRKVAIR